MTLSANNEGGTIMRYLVRRPETIFDKFFSDFDAPNVSLGSHLDIYKEDNKYVVNLEMPGFDKEEISIDFKDDVLSIEAKHTEETSEDDNKEYVYQSRRMKNVSRHIRFYDVDVDNIEANYENGLLNITLPMIGEEEPVVKRIELK